jgi:hypothetical protein
MRQQLLELPRVDAGKQVAAALSDFTTGCSIRAKIWEQELEIWLRPTQSYREGMVPLTHEAVPKDWIVGRNGLEVLVYPRFPAESEGLVVSACLAEGCHGSRAPNPENAGGFITSIAREGSDTPVPGQTLAKWEQPRYIQAAINQRLWKAGQAVAPLNAAIVGFLQGYNRTSVIYATVWPRRV